MNPRDALFLAHRAVGLRMLDAQCDKLDKAVGQTSTVASSVTIDMPWRNFISAQFRTKFHREVPLIFILIEILKIQCTAEASELHISSIRSSVSI